MRVNGTERKKDGEGRGWRLLRIKTQIVIVQWLNKKMCRV